MDTLQNRVRGYLESAGYDELLETSEDFLAIAGNDLHGARDTRLVWVIPTLEVDVEYRPQLERRLLREFAAKSQRHPNASRWLVTHVRGEWSDKFRSELTQFGIQQRAEIEFFDTPFKTETPEGDKATSEIRSLRDPTIHQQRIPQPYSILVGGEPQGKGDDLLDCLFNLDELREPKGSCLRIIVGPAGVGKTFLFQALFSRVYEHFINQKNRQEVFPRPIPLIPRYLHGATELRMQELIDRFIRADVAARIPLLDTFEWMLRHGYAVWLFDGLDELYAEDKTFFENLGKLLVPEDGESQAQIFLWARDSLLASCRTFVDFLMDYPPGSKEPAIRFYRLDDWDRSSKRAFAWLRFEGYVPKKVEADSPMVSRFLTYIERSDPLKSLSSLPYYCELLLEEFKRVGGKNPAEFSNDFALIDHVVSGIIEREKGKGLLKLEHFLPNGFNEWLETVAADFYAANFKGIDIADVETYAGTLLDTGLSKEEYRDTVTTLVQFPLFAPGLKPGVVAFKHELIAEYLAGLYWLRRITVDPERVGRELSTRIDFADSLIGRCIASRLQKEPEGIQALVRTLRWKRLSGRTFANLLQLLLLAAPTRDVLKSHGITVEGQDLSHLLFMRMDVGGFSFRGCNLSNTVFRDCNLQDAQFGGAYLIGTRFEQLSKEALRGADFGNLERFDFIYVDKKRIEDRLKAIEWVQKVTGRVEEPPQPCPTALQLRQLFLKFLEPDGMPRRDKLLESALVRGKRYTRAPLPKDCVDACLRFGYLQGPDFRHYIKRTLGDRYAEMVHFVRDWQLLDNMRRMLDSLCPETGCKHVPGS